MVVAVAGRFALRQLVAVLVTLRSSPALSDTAMGDAAPADCSASVGTTRRAPPPGPGRRPPA